MPRPSGPLNGANAEPGFGFSQRRCGAGGGRLTSPGRLRVGGAHLARPRRRPGSARFGIRRCLGSPTFGSVIIPTAVRLGTDRPASAPVARATGASPPPHVHTNPAVGPTARQMRHATTRAHPKPDDQSPAPPTSSSAAAASDRIAHRAVGRASSGDSSHTSRSVSTASMCDRKSDGIPQPPPPAGPERVGVWREQGIDQRQPTPGSKAGFIGPAGRPRLAHHAADHVNGHLVGEQQRVGSLLGRDERPIDRRVRQEVIARREVSVRGGPRDLGARVGADRAGPSDPTSGIRRQPHQRANRPRQHCHAGTDPACASR